MRHVDATSEPEAVRVAPAPAVPAQRSAAPAATPAPAASPEPARPATPPPGPTTPLRGRLAGPLAVLIPVLVALASGSYRIGASALGYDENATYAVATRTVGQIRDLALTIDGVIAPYYVFMHFWTSVFGTSEPAMRAPSVLTVAAGIGIVAHLGRTLFTPATGLVAGLILTLVPQLTRYAQEARAYGFAFLFAALATLLLYRALHRPTWGRWAAYAGAVALLGLSHMFALLLLAGHAIAVLTRWSAGRDRALLRWFAVAAVAVLPALPLAWLGHRQADEQLHWIPPVTWETVVAAPGDLFRSAAAALFVIGLAFTARWPDRRPVRELAWMAVLPPALLLAVSAAGSPLWVPRYAIYALAPLALLAATALRESTTRTVAALLTLFAVALPGQILVRGVASHDGPDFRRLAAVVAERAQPGDGIVYSTEGNWTLRTGMDRQFAGRPAPRDLLVARSAVDVHHLRAVECADVRACIGTTPRVWVVRQGVRSDPLSGLGVAEPTLRADYRRTRVWPVTNGTVALYSRTP
jgi:mannosyltransferase